MSLTLLVNQVEQARGSLESLRDRLAQVPTQQQGAVLAELEEINARLLRMISAAPDGQPAVETPEPAAFVSARMQAILNSITSLAVIYDEAGLVKITNHFAEEMFGFDPINMQRSVLMERLSVRDDHDNLVLPEQMPAARAARGEVVREERLEITNARGRVYSILASAYPVEVNGRRVGSVSVWDDITEYKRTEAALEAAHAAMLSERGRLLAVMEALPIGLAIYDMQGGVTQANSGYDSVWGSPRPAASSVEEYDAYKAWWVETGQPLLPQDWASALAVTTGQAVIGQELKIQRFDGTFAYVINSAAPVQDAQGHLIGGAVAIMDITERVEAEHALRESEQRYRHLADAMPQLIFSASPGGKVDYYNQRFHEYDGIRQREDQSWEWVEAIHPDDHAASLEAWEAVLHNQNSYQIEQRLRKADGTYHWHLTRVVPALDEQGNVVKLYGAATDIEEQKQVEAALRASERRFHVALSALPMTVFTMDANLRYTWIYNPRFGLPADQILNNREEITALHTSPDLLAVKKTVLESGQGERREIKTFLNGEWKYFLLSLEPMRSDAGNVIGLIGASLDVSEQRRIELEHRETIMQIEVQRRLIENRENERREIARDIHDGPIQTLVSNIFNIQMAKETINHPAMKLELDQISMSLKSAVRELRDVVNELRPPALLRFGLSRALAIYAEDFREKHRHITLELSCVLPNDGMDLPEETTLTLYRICQEALNNVVRHAEASNIWVRIEMQEDAQLFLEIRDNGKGFQVPADMTSQMLGGHFGLVGMKERVKAIGGDLRIYSQPGEGTSVEITVPQAQVELN